MDVDVDLIRESTLELSRRDFWEYCQTIAPNFYTENRDHLFQMCYTLQALYEGKLINPNNNEPYKKLMINVPPQHGKSRTLVNFVDWMLGKNQEERIIQCSYNDTVAVDFSRYVRDGIDAEKNEEEDIIFSDIFPEVKLKQGDKSIQRWALEGQHFNYISSGVGGSITSKGGTVLIIDDPIKNSEIALNDLALEKIYNWYTGTFLSRVSAIGGEPLEIIIMTRWSKGDICGRILEGEDANDWFVLKMEAYDKRTNSMLCPDMLSKKRYDLMKRVQLTEIFRANYHQEPIDIEGVLYKNLKTYTDIPRDKKGEPLFDQIRAYGDTADEGSDWLAIGAYGVYKREAYLLDVYYTKDGMEITEVETAKFLLKNKVKRAKIESNNGGRGFARAVIRVLKSELNTFFVMVKWFHQGKNKRARILSNSSFVMNHIYFPVNWKDRFPEYYLDMVSYKKDGGNKHDDAQDMTTGIAEDVSKKLMEFG